MIDMEDLADLDRFGVKFVSVSQKILKGCLSCQFVLGFKWFQWSVCVPKSLFCHWSIVKWWEHRHVAIQQPCPPHSSAPLSAACFPLVSKQDMFSNWGIFPRIISLVEVRIVELFLLGGSQAAFLQTPSFDAICKCKLCHLRGASQLLSPELLQIVFGCFWQKQSVSLCTRPCLPTCASSINFFHTACCRRFTLVFQARKRDCSPYPEEKKAGQHESGWERSLKQKACCDRFEKGGSSRC